MIKLHFAVLSLVFYDLQLIRQAFGISYKDQDKTSQILAICVQSWSFKFKCSKSCGKEVILSYVFYQKDYFTHNSPKMF